MDGGALNLRNPNFPCTWPPYVRGEPNFQVIVAVDFSEGDDKSAQKQYVIAAHESHADIIEAENTCALAPKS